ncbi:hypothetical protein LX36DRAFT_464080 [Colletotrichum falcatum]|nr:hypothetical protein LX36DRAFT_464080 [Colletotrichum falcatum]
MSWTSISQGDNFTPAVGHWSNTCADVCVVCVCVSQGYMQPHHRDRAIVNLIFGHSPPTNQNVLYAEPSATRLPDLCPCGSLFPPPPPRLLTNLCRRTHVPDRLRHHIGFFMCQASWDWPRTDEWRCRSRPGFKVKNASPWCAYSCYDKA